MFYAVQKNGELVRSQVYDTWEEYWSDTFTPDCEIVGIVEYKVHGSAYTDRKESVREQAQVTQNLMSIAEDISWYELMLIEEYFRKQGKRYGLLKEFRINGIC